MRGSFDKLFNEFLYFGGTNHLSDLQKLYFLTAKLMIADKI